jgi:hypothetical protein
LDGRKDRTTFYVNLQSLTKKSCFQTNEWNLEAEGPHKKKEKSPEHIKI